MRRAAIFRNAAQNLSSRHRSQGASCPAATWLALRRAALVPRAHTGASPKDRHELHEFSRISQDQQNRES